MGSQSSDGAETKVKDGDLHKNVPIREMFERIVNALDAITIELLTRDRTQTKTMLNVAKQVSDLRDIMSKADD